MTTNQHPSPWAWITYQQVASELVELIQAPTASLEVAALRFDEQGQASESRSERNYCRAMADAVRCLITAQKEQDA